MELTESKPEDYLLPARWQSAAIPLMGIGAVVVIISWLMQYALLPENSFKIFCHSYLANFMFILSFAIGGMFHVLVSFLTRAGWNASVRRIPEILSSLIPWMALLFIPILLTLVKNGTSLYSWNGKELHGLVAQKTDYLNGGFFTARSVFYFVAWSIIVLWYYRLSLKQDETKDVESTKARQKWSGPCIMIFALSVSFAAWDWIMSINGDWYSTIYGVYFFSASMFGLFSFTILSYLLLQRAGKVQKTVNIEHYHDLAKFLFGFVMFWSYIAFGQLLLIWYANIPEETQWYRQRWENGWYAYSYLLIIVHFAIPFLGLLSLHVRRNRFGLMFWSIWAIAAHWIDMTFLVMPSATGLVTSVMIGHFICGIGMFSIFVGMFLLRATNVPLTTKGDPRLHEALSYANPIL
jgi:hypothetical protein